MVTRRDVARRRLAVERRADAGAPRLTSDWRPRISAASPFLHFSESSHVEFDFAGQAAHVADQAEGLAVLRRPGQDRI